MDEQMQSLKSWPEKERPRERLLTKGPQALSDAELLAVILRSGRCGQDVLSLSRHVIETFGGLRGLGAANAPELRKIKGLGPAKVTALLAISEMNRRQLKENMTGRDVIRDPEAVLLYLKRCLQDKPVEVFKVLFLNKANAVLEEADLSTGTVDEAYVHPREIVKKALEFHAASILLVHNHPSGRTDPSPEDLHITRKIQNACESVSIKVLDHIIIGGDNYYSFREQGRIS